MTFSTKRRRRRRAKSNPSKRLSLQKPNGVIEPPQSEVIEEILQHCGLWHSSAPRAPPEPKDLVLELDAAYTDSSIGSPDAAEQPQELTYVDINTFLATF